MVHLKHKIDREEFKNYIVEIDLAGSYGEREYKSLKAYVNMTDKNVKFKVYNHRELVKIDQDLERIIDYYNNI